MNKIRTAKKRPVLIKLIFMPNICFKHKTQLICVNRKPSEQI